MTWNGTLAATLPGDIHVAVPGTLNCLTTYVLHEQLDWFEDEIRFVRAYVKSGMRAVDIGANYGVYALTLARGVGPSGQVWAFEPASATAEHLRASIQANGFSQLKLVQAALSDRVGTATFFTGADSELNSLSNTGRAAQQETVDLTTLDRCRDAYDWPALDFLKIDAEGEEAKILAAGVKTLTTCSPLVMFELKHGDQVNLPLIAAFRQLGYACYQLIPGVNALAPIQAQSLDAFALNLFCCRPDRAAQLRDRGLLVDEWPIAPGDTPGYDDVASLYANARNVDLSITERVGCLVHAVAAARAGVASEVDAESTALFVRTALDIGQRALAVQFLGELLKKHAQSAPPTTRAAPIAACQRYDGIAPHGSRGDWLLASVIERYIATHAFSTYFSGGATLPLFRRLLALGYADEAVQRRFHLVQAYFGAK